MMKTKPSKRAPTMDDVARLAGVNRVTASVALRGARAGTHVSEATRQRILDVASQLGYTPNAIALALRRQRTNIIGFYTGYESFNAHDPFTAEIINGLQSGCETHQQDLLMFGSFAQRPVDQIYAALASGKIDGLVLLPSPYSPVLDKLIESHLPIVAVSNSLSSVPSVVVDDVGGSRMLVSYLAQRGHRRMLYCGDQSAHTSTVRRQVAFQAAVAALGLDVAVSLRPFFDYSVLKTHYLDVAPADRPTVLACWVDSLAYAMVEQCELLGIRVPQDLAIVGFDGIVPRIKPAYVPTTIRAPWEAVAATAVDLLLEIIAGKEVAQETILPVELVVGQTA
jgi:DNA-binding LacI/PurR family transcriptional regulator